MILSNGSALKIVPASDQISLIDYILMASHWGILDAIELHAGLSTIGLDNKSSLTSAYVRYVSGQSSTHSNEIARTTTSSYRLHYRDTLD